MINSQVAFRRARFLAHWYYLIKFVITILIFGTTIKKMDFENLGNFEIIILIIVGLIVITTTTSLIRYIYYVFRVRAHNKSINISNYVIVRCGEPGCGKTSSALYDAVLLADKMWAELRYKYWLDIAREKEIYESGNTEKIADWQSIKDSYLFYINNDCYPCLWTNIPAQVAGKFTNECTRQHLEQELRLPEYSVLLYDEIGSEVSIDETLKNRPILIARFARWCRHYGEFRIIFCEQDRGNINKDLRRVVSENKYLYHQKSLLKPQFLNWLYERKKHKYIKKMDSEQSKKYASQMKFFELFLWACGFRKYKFKNYGNTENVSGEVGDKGTFVLPALLNVDYDSRCYRFEYEARDKLLLSRIWTSLFKSKNIDKDNK